MTSAPRYLKSKATGFIALLLVSYGCSNHNHGPASVSSPTDPKVAAALQKIDVPFYPGSTLTTIGDHQLLNGETGVIVPFASKDSPEQVAEFYGSALGTTAKPFDAHDFLTSSHFVAAKYYLEASRKEGSVHITIRINASDDGSTIGIAGSAPYQAGALLKNAFKPLGKP